MMLQFNGSFIHKDICIILSLEDLYRNILYKIVDSGPGYWVNAYTNTFCVHWSERSFGWIID